MTGPEWTHQRIVFAVREKGTSLSSLSTKHGFSRQTLNWSLYRMHPRAHRIIADFLGFKLQEIWPRWYDDAGNPRPLTNAKRQTLRQATKLTRSAA